MADQAIVDSYLNQVFTCLQGKPAPPGPNFVFGSAAPLGGNGWEALHERQNDMLEQVRAAGYEALPGYATGLLRDFVEPVVYAQGLDLIAAVDLARPMQVDMFVERTPGQLHVIDKDGSRIAEGPEHPCGNVGLCVMRNEDPREVCVVNGGPYGLEAMNAGVKWWWQRERLVAAFGCHTCEQGVLYRAPGRGVFTEGGPVPLVPHVAPTRFVRDPYDESLSLGVWAMGATRLAP